MALLLKMEDLCPLNMKNNLKNCFWCDVKIKATDKKEALPGNRGNAHIKCAEEWYLVQIANTLTHGKN
jgi:hypothetical protein